MLRLYKRTIKIRIHRGGLYNQLKEAPITFYYIVDEEVKYIRSLFGDVATGGPSRESIWDDFKYFSKHKQEFKRISFKALPKEMKEQLTNLEYLQLKDHETI